MSNPSSVSEEFVEAERLMKADIYRRGKAEGLREAATVARQAAAQNYKNRGTDYYDGMISMAEALANGLEIIAAAHVDALSPPDEVMAVTALSATGKRQ